MGYFDETGYENWSLDQLIKEFGRIINNPPISMEDTVRMQRISLEITKKVREIYPKDRL